MEAHDVTGGQQVVELGPVAVVPGRVAGVVQHGHPEAGCPACDRAADAPPRAPAEAITFERDIQPILTRFGCNAGACHGKARGQNGFQLSLLAYDNDFDFNAITAEARGRRIFPANPPFSLILRKASGQVPHGGGQRFKVGSPDYNAMLAVDWRMVHFSAGDLRLYADGNYYGKQYFDAFNTERDAQGAYGVANARLSFESSGKRGWAIAAWIKNISNRQYLAYALNQKDADTGALGFDYALVGEQRTYGTTLSVLQGSEIVTFRRKLQQAVARRGGRRRTAAL